MTPADRLLGHFDRVNSPDVGDSSRPHIAARNIASSAPEPGSTMEGKVMVTIDPRVRFTPKVTAAAAGMLWPR